MTDKKDLSRRDFLEASAAMSAILLASCGGNNGSATRDASVDTAIGDGATHGDSAASDTATAADSASASDSTTAADATDAGLALVAMVRDATSVEQAVRDAVAMVGGIPDLTGKTVLLKVCLNMGDASPYSTSPGVLSAAIKIVSEQGAAQIIVGDRSNPATTTAAAFTKAGLDTVITMLKGQGIPVEQMEFDTAGTPTTLLKPATATHWPNGFTTYTICTTADYIVNLCCCKSHTLTGANYTMAMKAWQGIMIQANRTTAHNDLGNCLPEYHLGVKENLVIMDCTQICLTNGPNPAGNNVTAAPNIVVASKDNVANDISGLCILKYYLAQAKATNAQISGSIWAQPQIIRGLALGNGWISDKSQYSYQSKGITEIASIMGYLT